MATSKFLARLEDQNIEFGLKANTLEEAFVKMGEKEFKTSANQLKDLEDRIEKISSKEYSINSLS